MTPVADRMAAQHFWVQRSLLSHENRPLFHLWHCCGFVCVQAHACAMSPSLQPQGSCSLTFFVRWPFPYIDTVCHCVLHRLLVSSGTCSPQAHRNAAWQLLDFSTEKVLSGVKHAHQACRSFFILHLQLVLGLMMYLKKRERFVALGEQVSLCNCSKGPKCRFMTKRELMSVHARLSGTDCSKLESGLFGLGCHLLKRTGAAEEFRDDFLQKRLK